MKNCAWCSCKVDEHKADLDGNHRDLFGCIEAQKRRIKSLTQQIIDERMSSESLIKHYIQELIDERVYSAALTEALENCVTCPAADYEEK